MAFRITVNGEPHLVDAAPDTPLLYVLRNDLGLSGPKFGCGLGQCGACAAIVGGKLTRTCSIALRDVGEDQVTTLEGLGTVAKASSFAEGVHRRAGRSVRLLLERHDHGRKGFVGPQSKSQRARKSRTRSRISFVGAASTIGLCARFGELQRSSRNDGQRSFAQTLHAVAWCRHGYIRPDAGPAFGQAPELAIQSAQQPKTWRGGFDWTRTKR